MRITAPLNPEIVDNVIKATAKKYFIADADILGESRKRTIAQARFVVYYILRVEYGFNLSAIGDHMNRDHSTVYHGSTEVLNALQAKQSDAVSMEFVNRVARIIKAVKDETAS